MTDYIELHDSTVSFSVAGEPVVIQFCPAYIHHWERSSSGWVGEGRSQTAELIVVEGSFPSPPPKGNFDVSDGWLKVGAQLHENLIPIPIDERVPVQLRLELVNAEPMEVSGIGVTLRLVGEPQRIEDLPSEWAPEDDSQ
jgi:hypothetical protein